MRQDFLQCYQVTIKTLAPVYVGSGREIGKKEYIFLNKGKVGIVDIQNMYGVLCKLRKEKEFESYMLGRQNVDLGTWLKQQGMCIEDVKPCMKYTLDCADAVIVGDRKRLQIMECMKDAYGSPYIPGSSLKGMFRTILLGAQIWQKPQKYQNAKREMERSMDGRASRTSYLQRDIRAVEGIAYRTLQREKTKPQDAVNDVLQGLVVSDSEPLTVEDLVLCQKIDVHVKKGEKPLPMLRECLKPGKEIKFTVTIDTQLCPYTKENIMEAVEIFADGYYKSFLSAFSGAKRPEKQDVFLGGGCGFATKTVIYPLYGKKEGIGAVVKVFEKTNVPRVHKHYLDREYGVSPHTMKCTKYKNQIYQMGLCRIEEMEHM